MDAQETRRLLELAAKAAGYDVAWSERWNCFSIAVVPRPEPPFSERLLWRPNAENSDAFRLACDLSIDILHRVVGGQRVEVIAPGVPPIIEHCTKETRAAATRLAILRAAAAVGERMNAAP